MRNSVTLMRSTCLELQGKYFLRKFMFSCGNDFSRSWNNNLRFRPHCFCRSAGKTDLGAIGHVTFIDYGSDCRNMYCTKQCGKICLRYIRDGNGLCCVQPWLTRRDIKTRNFLRFGAASFDKPQRLGKQRSLILFCR